MATTLDSVSASAANAASAVTSTPSTKNEAGSADRFLKLLVAQMQNQDPLKPMDNAQITSQIAQINTVSGIEKLNATMLAMSNSFTQMQTLQGASLVGRDVLVAGNRLSTNSEGAIQGGFELDTPADSVRVEILSGGGALLDTLTLGAESTGKHGFTWTPRAGVDSANASTFRVVAKSGSAAVAATPLMRDHVDAVATGGSALTLELRVSGSVPYADIKAFN